MINGIIIIIRAIHLLYCHYIRASTKDYTQHVIIQFLLVIRCSVGLLVLVDHNMFPCTHSFPNGDVCWQLFQIRQLRETILIKMSLQCVYQSKGKHSHYHHANNVNMKFYLETK